MKDAHAAVRMQWPRCYDPVTKAGSTTGTPLAPLPAVRRITVLALLACIYTSRRAGAQTPVPPSASDICEGLPVRAVNVETQRPAFRGAMSWWRKIARGLGLHHETTARGLVRRFVSLDPGRPCTEFRRMESERILRAQPYLAAAAVLARGVRDSVDVDVTTVDEVPVLGGARFRGARLEALNLGTMNLLGAGAHVEGRWERGHAYRDGIGAVLSHPQVLGKPYTLAFDGMRYPIGESYAGALSHPFLTDLQRVAWHAGYRVSKDFARLRRTPSGRVEVGQPLSHTLWSAGGVLRFGPPRRLGLAGGMVIGEHVLPSNQLFEIDSISGRLVPVANDIPRFGAYDARSLAGVLGLRVLTFSRMRALDALAAEQDVAAGTQLGTVAGMDPFKGPRHHGFASVDVYAGRRTDRTFAAVRTEVESRLDPTTRDWSHLVASGRAAWYFKPADRWTSELSLEGAGVWRAIVPFQLELGDRQGGVRGYAGSHEAGAQRLLLRLEERARLGTVLSNRAAFGAAVFADAGRVWAGDAPYGVDTPVRASVGVALLGSLPVNSRRTMRAELALPLSRTLGARPELRFIVREPARGFWTDPPRIRWARLSAVPEQIFAWP